MVVGVEQDRGHDILKPLKDSNFVHAEFQIELKVSALITVCADSKSSVVLAQLP